ncbi:cytochrome P450 2U1-like protein, partial [Leptotrombidium deliense]
MNSTSTAYLVNIHLSFLGAGKSTFEYKVHEFLDRVEEYVDSKQGKPNDYFEILTNFSSNVILSLCLTKDYKYDDPEYTAIRDAIHNIFTSFSCMNFLLSGRGYHLYSCLKPDQKEKWNTVNANVSILNHYVSGIIDERMKTFDRKNCNDLLDYYLNEANGENSDLFHKNAICDKIAELILGGTETTSALLYHALWLLAKHQNIQENMFQEINEKLGHNCLVSFVDKELFPYTNAVVSEIQRFVCLVPLVTTHVSRGVRKCIGAKLAEVDIFLAIVRLTQTFKWTCCENKNDDVTMVQE